VGFKLILLSWMENNDNLQLESTPNVQKILGKYCKKGDTPEKIVFSDYVIKINRKDKEQTRVMLITNKAIYNLLPGRDNQNIGKCKRRIEIKDLAAITLSQKSDEFVIHVPKDYDYRYKSARKEMIQEIVSGLFKTIDPSNKLGVSKVKDLVLKDVALTKHMSKYQTREQILKRREQLLAVDHDSDNEDRKEAREASATVTNMLTENKEDAARLVDFELLKVLGRGAFGKVMQVKKISDGKIYAMKILKKKAIVERNQVEHTKAERKILQELQHPFLMTLRHAFQSPEKLYLVLDYYKGGELFFHLKSQRRFSEHDARIYVGEIGLALGHLHSLSVIYRDLKPENILLDDDGHVCLTDFGLAKDVGEGEKTETFCGTPEYLAPEIIQGFGHDKAVDWWSLGILLYELTVGIPPFYSRNVNEMYNKIQHGVLRFPPFLSDPCKDIITRLLNRDPKKRMGSAKDFEELKEHQFFKSINFDHLYAKKIKPTFKPALGANAAETDTSMFDEQFLNEPVVDSVVPDGNLGSADNAEFQGFTYAGGKSELGS